MTGTTIIVIILVPIAFQVFMLAIKQEKRYQEIKQMLKSLEEKLNKL
jgi:preprotein translocase subunit YajC